MSMPKGASGSPDRNVVTEAETSVLLRDRVNVCWRSTLPRMSQWWRKPSNPLLWSSCADVLYDAGAPTASAAANELVHANLDVSPLASNESGPTKKFASDSLGARLFQRSETK